jgi:nucleoside-diphosphate-sugar epimerase
MGDTAGSMAATKPNVLIIGGLGKMASKSRGLSSLLTSRWVAGYIGRFLTNYIHANSLAATLRIVDKQLPQLASLAPEHKDACSDNFVQADASRPQSLSRVFDLPDGQTFDYVFNCGGETRHSQDDEVYKLRSYELSITVAKEAARRNVKAYVELSTGTVYDSKRDPPRKETDKLKPSLKQAKWKLQAEEDLSKIPNLPLVILRLPNVYGPYSGQWMGTQLALARVYQGIEKELKWLWGPELRTHTVHIDDVVRACYTAADWRANQAQSGAAADSAPPTPTSPTPKKGPTSSASVFNIVDKGDTSQGTMADITKALFGIETGFQNMLINTFARFNLESVVDELNDETLDPWAELQEKAGLDGGSGPLSPFMEKELLREADLCLDGTKFEQTVGFK